MKALVLFSAFLLSVYLDLSAQSIQVPVSFSAYDTAGVIGTIENFKGKESIYLKRGLLTIKGVSISDGIFEADFSVGQERSFPGFVFRMQDAMNYENFYVRPHQSGNPDASQYTPVFYQQAGWQLYHGAGYSAAIRYKANEWHHLKIDFHGLQAEIYIDDMDKPLISVKETLTGWKSGKLGISGGPMHLSNVSYSPKNGSASLPLPVPENGTDGLITQYEISNAVSAKQFENIFELNGSVSNSLQWSKQRTEPSGTINLARYWQATEDKNGMVVRMVIQSDADQYKTLRFGFSESVKLYCNGKAVFAGDDVFLSRDYRFLGTIGFFDRVFLPLKKGKNEVWFVISKTVGGWGMKAKFDDMKGIRLQ